MARSDLVLYAFVWEKGRTMDFSETIVVYDIKVGKCRHLNEYMSRCECQRSRSFIDLFHTCDLSRSGVKVPIWRLSLHPPNEAAEILIRNSDFSLLPKAETCFPITADACFMNEITTGSDNWSLLVSCSRSVYRLSSVNKNQHIFRQSICCLVCIN